MVFLQLTVSAMRYQRKKGWSFTRMTGFRPARIREEIANGINDGHVLLPRYAACTTQ